MSRSRILVILNPSAGGGRCGKKAPAVLAALRDAGLDLETRATSAPGEATAIASDGWRAGFRSFVAAGGDGTANEVLNGILPAALGQPQRAALGFLPLGTGNSFVRDFTAAPEEYCVRALRDERTRPSDVLRARHAAGERFAIGVVSLGFPAQVAALVNRSLKTFGRLGYSLGVVVEVIRLAPIELRLGCDGAPPAPRRLLLASLNNNRHVGGRMNIAPDALIDDGLADLVLAAPVGRLELLRWFPRIFRGTHVSHPAIEVSKVRTVGFELRHEIDTMVDGESLTLRLEQVELLPAAIDVIV